jgi:hypothetical protein
MAVLHEDHGVTRGLIENLSLFGVSVLADQAPIEGDTLDVELVIHGRQPLVVLGHVVRVDARPAPASARIAIDFDRVPAGAEDLIEDEIVAAYAAAQARPVVILEGGAPRRAALAAAVRARGMTPLVPRTPLEVIDLLSRHETHAEVFLVSGRFAGLDSAELTAFLTETYPWIRIAAVRSDIADAADQACASWRDVHDHDWK